MRLHPRLARLSSPAYISRCSRSAFKGLIADPAYGGRYVSLTPGHKCEISDTEYKSLVKAHISQHTSNLAFCV